MDSITRRYFLAGLGVTTASASLLGRSIRLFAEASHPEPHIEFPSAPRSRIAVASWPFRAYIDSPTNDDRKPGVPGMDLKDFAAHVSSKFNIRNIEPYNWHFSSTGSKYLDEFRAALQKANAKAVNIAVDGEESYYDPDPATRKKAVDFSRRWIDVAATIGAPSIRTHVARAKNSAPDLQRTSDSLRQVAEYAAQKNVVANLENDDPVSEDPFFLVKVIEKVNHPYLRALPDFANSMQGGDADFNYRAVEAMFHHAYSICHIKDGETPASREPFTIDLARTFGILKSARYRGYCSIEFDGQSDPHEPTARLIDAAVRFLA